MRRSNLHRRQFPDNATPRVRPVLEKRKAVAGMNPGVVEQVLRLDAVRKSEWRHRLSPFVTASRPARLAIRRLGASARLEHTRGRCCSQVMRIRLMPTAIEPCLRSTPLLASRLAPLADA